ncbi:HAMP domain-containing sensor histidine kinase [Arcicella sp. LKC2W]|uniref:HAMP domain-containing sensor histidine kinase n=1 Tax=Arcicella sp. LKC2W TaxID=2984198 RepID=UPI002B21FDEB|nr:HAMP domain-containing sensor histidine kinase [Arcicella sp. LKC2W]MEA5457964.1 HAMP domain-containing sensor histidine kinase [Arcicella sp. LKC2W]
MTIRTRITFLFLGIVSTLLLIFCLIIYLESEFHRESEFKNRLREEARTSAEILFGKEEISPDLLKLLDKNQMTVLTQEEIVIYNSKNKIVYESGTDFLTIQLKTLAQIRQEKELYFRKKDREVLGIVFNNGKEDLVIVASALDKYGLSEQRNLGLILAFGGLLMLLIVSYAGWFFAGKSLKPIQDIIKKVDSIGASQLNLRLNEGNGTDEIAQLSQRFNRMLDRIEKAFKLQRSFVSHASHELRTPLTAITGQIQVSLLAEDDPQELKMMIQSVLDDVQQLNRLTNNLLEMTSIDSDDAQIKFSLVNVAELVWQVREVLLKKNPHYQIITELDENSDLLPEVKANEALLYTVLLNLMENGVKFSPKNRVDIRFQITQQELILSFHNDGAVIPEKELGLIFEPFRRGSNSRNIKGHGVGLSLTQKIVKLHNGNISVQSTEKEGTVFTLKLLKIQ